MRMTVVADIDKKIGLVFVHGAGLGSWIWRDVSPLLQMPHLFTDFPEREADMVTRKELTLEDYVNYIMQQIEGFGAERIIIVAHSLGGVVAQKVAAHLGDRLAGFIAVGAAIPAHGGSFLSTLPAPNRWIMHAAMKMLGTKPPESAIRKGLCNDLSPELADEVVRRFTPESLAIYFKSTHVEIPKVPTSYIRLTKDQEFGVPMQTRMAAHLGVSKQEIIDIASGHLPMLSHPKELAVAIQSFTI